MSTEIHRVDDEPEVEEAPERPAWSRWVITGAAALAILLLGATLGMFLTQTFDDSPAAVPAAGSVEVGFAQDMSVHHLQAVTMANWARDHSTDVAIRQLAFDIETSQTEQVGRMKGWLMLWDQPEQATGAYMSWMTDPTMGGHTGMPMPQTAANGAPMPGMATNADLAKLRSLTGKALDIQFLQLMVRHHQGGTAMATYAQEHSSLNALKLLTKSILTSQGAEMDLMKQMLAARGASPLPAA